MREIGAVLWSEVERVAREACPWGVSGRRFEVRNRLERGTVSLITDAECNVRIELLML
jgi:hypothetical protein